jgi:hypothetical protein
MLITPEPTVIWSAPGPLAFKIPLSSEWLVSVITARRSSQWQQIAAMPAPVFEAHIRTAKTPRSLAQLSDHHRERSNLIGAGQGFSTIQRF